MSEATPRIPVARRAAYAGTAVHVWDYAGADPAILFCHCAGGCGRLWDPVIQRLPLPNRLLAMDARGHGDSDKPRHPSAYGWQGFAQDVLATASLLTAPEGLLGVGHSGGAATLVHAALEHPGMFSRLVLMDAIVAPPEFFAEVGFMMDAARKRKEIFASREEAHRRLAGKPPMSAWRPEVMESYLHHALLLQEDGRLRLKCPPEIESWIYGCGGMTDLYDRLSNMRCKTLVITGEDSYMVSYVHLQHSRLPYAELVTLPGTGHFIPQERPQESAALIAEFLSRPA